MKRYLDLLLAVGAVAILAGGCDCGRSSSGRGDEEPEIGADADMDADADAEAADRPEATEVETEQVGPRIAVDPPEVDFGLALPGRMLTQDLYVRNVGDRVLEIASIEIEPGTTVDGELSFEVFGVASDDWPLLVEPGVLAVVAISYDQVPRNPPSDCLEDQASLAIASSDPTRPEVVVPVIGRDLGSARLFCDVDTVRFHDYTPGILETEKLICVNSGGLGRPLRVDAVSLADGSSEAFTVSTQALPVELESGGAIEIEVRYLTRGWDGDAGTLVIESTDCFEALRTVPLEAVELETEPAYGVFQLYGDEYQSFRQKMGFSLQDYWTWVDDNAASLDVRFTRTNTLLIWGLVEQVLGQGYSWDTQMHTDAVVRAVYAPAADKQMDILLVLQPGRGAQGSPPYPDGLEQEYSDFVRAAVERYDGDGQDDADGNVRVRHWQVMNEPFFALDDGRLTVEQYAELVRLSFEAVQEADPGARVVLGDVGRHLTDVLPLLADQVKPHAVDLHYWNMGGPEYELPVLGAVRQALDAEGLTDTEIWMCEFGTYVHAPGSLPEHTAEDQARYLVKSMVANRAAGVSRILWNNLVAWEDFAGNPDSVFNFMGLISSGTASGDPAESLGLARISYHVFLRMVAETGRRVAREPVELSDLPDDVRAFDLELREGEGHLLVAWSDGGEGEVALPCVSSRVRVTNLVPDAAGSFEDSVEDCPGPSISVRLGEDPVLITSEE